MKNLIILSYIIFLIDHSVSGQSVFKKADSLFSAGKWKEAKAIYESTLNDTTVNPLAWNRLGFCNYNLKFYDLSLNEFNKSLIQNPPAGLKPILFSRIAKIYAIKRSAQKAFAFLDSALTHGYLNYKELDTLADFNGIRSAERFKQIRQTAFNNANPCMSDAHHRKFDFWVGEWNVLQTANMQNTGAHSSIQLISGGCAILENWESPASNGKSINFIDPITNKWKQSWAGNYANGTQEFLNGEYIEGAMRFEFTTAGTQGEKIIGHLIFYNQGTNQVRQFNETSADGGKTWTTNYDFTYVRMK